MNQVSSAYWESRKDSIYLYVARQICLKYASSSKTVMDVGSNGTPTLEWHREGAERLVSLDLRKPYISAGIESIKQDFFDYQSNEKFDLVTCFQVLEHVPNPKEFANKLLALAKTLVVSVPYQWPEGKCKWHIHDPVSEDKLADWFSKAPKFSYICRELNGVERLIQVYS